MRGNGHGAHDLAGLRSRLWRLELAGKTDEELDAEMRAILGAGAADLSGAALLTAVEDALCADYEAMDPDDLSEDERRDLTQWQRNRAARARTHPTTD